LIIHRLSVHPEFQGKGVAKEILKFIEACAFENNYSSIRLDAYSGNERALKLYENFGYKKAGQFMYPKRDLPFYCYEKNI
jgi:ribosomal protein S18 acetylase RimI-like enzyme